MFYTSKIPNFFYFTWKSASVATFLAKKLEMRQFYILNKLPVFRNYLFRYKHSTIISIRLCFLLYTLSQWKFWEMLDFFGKFSMKILAWIWQNSQDWSFFAVILKILPKSKISYTSATCAKFPVWVNGRLEQLEIYDRLPGWYIFCQSQSTLNYTDHNLLFSTAGALVVLTV